MAEWVAGAGTTALGIIGTVLGGYAAANGGLGNLLGNKSTTTSYETSNATMHDINDAKEIAYRDMQIAQLQADKNTDTKLLEVYKQLASQDKAISERISEFEKSQAVVNCSLTSGLAVANNNIGSLQTLINDLTKVVIPSTNVYTPSTTTTTTTA